MRLGRREIDSGGFKMRSVIVRTGLDDEVVYRGKSYRRHASVRIVETPPPVVPREPMLGDPWEPLTVRARLERMNEVYGRQPHSRDTRPPQPPGSCMPEPVREPWKDAAPGPLRLLPNHADIVAAHQVVDALTKEERSIAWAIAIRMSDRALGRHLRKSHHTAAHRKQAVLDALVAHWNTLDWWPDAEDINRARRFIHRDFK